VTGPIEKMLGVARTALERFHDVTADDDGALTFAHGGVLCVVQGLELEEGLPVLNLTCVVAWDLPVETDIPTRVAMGAGEGLFGTPRVIRGGEGGGRDAALRVPGVRPGREGDGHAAHARGRAARPACARS
jgi:hypothetical protein